MSKLTEYVIFDQTFQHFIQNDLFHPNHHGGLPNHSTVTALIQLYDLWLNAAENQDLLAALLLDLSAAFDLLDHGVYLKKLPLYGFYEDSVQYIHSYLTERKQIVQVESKQSESKEIGDTGVPQGSVLGGFFFLLNQNDFPDNSEDAESVLFVDDDTDNVSDKDPNNLENKLQIQADFSTQWVHDNKMVCSGEKTKVMILCTKDTREAKLSSIDKTIKVNVCGKVVTETVDEKLLGMIISNNLSWKTYLHGNQKTGDEKIVGLIAKLSQRVGILTKLSNVMPSDKFDQICEGLFTSKLIYCLPLWAHVFNLPTMDDNNRRYTAFSKSDNRRLQVLQNRVLRLKTGLPRDTHLTDLLQESNCMSVQQLTAYHTLMTVHRVITTGFPKYLANKLKLKKPGVVVFPHRQLNTIEVPNVNLTLSRGGFIYRGAILWNLLPQIMRSEENPKSFKNQLRKWIKSNISPKPS